MASELTVPVSLVRKIVDAAIDEAIRGTRPTNILTGAVEDIDDETLDVVWIRMDAETMGSDPTQSDNYEAPGIIPAIRLGETFIDEQVRVNFDASAGATAMRTSAQIRSVWPFGAETGQRIIADGIDGVIAFYNVDDELVGFLSPDLWFTGKIGGEQVTLDPLGGLRIRDADGHLVGLFDAASGLQLRDMPSGVVQVTLGRGELHLSSVDGVNTADVGPIPTVKFPLHKGAVENPPGSFIATPAPPLFGAADFDLRYSAWWHNNSDKSAATFTPPAGYTERLDAVQAIPTVGNSSLGVAAATNQPASAAAQNITCTDTGFQFGIGMSIIVEGDAGTPPSFRSSASVFKGWVSPGTLPFSLDMPAGVTAGDLLVAVVAFGADGGGVPAGWVAPPGWVFLEAQVVLGTLNTLAVGVWAKIASASEPASETISITTAGGAHAKQLHGFIVAVQNPKSGSAGYGVRVNGDVIPAPVLREILNDASQNLTASFANIIGTSSITLPAGNWLLVANATTVYSIGVATVHQQVRIQNTTDGTTVRLRDIRPPSSQTGTLEFNLRKAVSIDAPKTFQLQGLTDNVTGTQAKSTALLHALPISRAV